jgi:hypothetical protein
MLVITPRVSLRADLRRRAREYGVPVYILDELGMGDSVDLIAKRGLVLLTVDRIG